MQLEQAFARPVVLNNKCRYIASLHITVLCDKPVLGVLGHKSLSDAIDMQSADHVAHHVQPPRQHLLLESRVSV
jgi:hypothetical protein